MLRAPYSTGCWKKWTKRHCIGELCAAIRQDPAARNPIWRGRGSRPGDRRAAGRQPLEVIFPAGENLTPVYPLPCPTPPPSAASPSPPTSSSRCQLVRSTLTGRCPRKSAGKWVERPPRSPPATRSNCGEPLKTPVPPCGGDARSGTRGKLRKRASGLGMVKTWRIPAHIRRPNGRSAAKQLRPTAGVERSTTKRAWGARRPLKYSLSPPERALREEGRRPQSPRERVITRG